MIDDTKFPAVPYRQSASECIPASFAVATYPFTSVDVATCVAHVCGDWTNAAGASGYDRVASVFSSGSSASATAAKAAVTIERRHGLAGLEGILRDEQATAIVALTFPSRDPHSVVVSYDGSAFVLRDSAASGHAWPDGLRCCLADVLALVPSNGNVGDVIVFRAV